ncbi:MAG TPA: elongation factor P [Myxococcota bacterium]|nr:elongation factor P [Myxococcota bacterium]HOA14530.1 elongation factor P [Myxococcota bacterium]HOH76664.1 elongation factor P [Myxococcota bacterium]HPV03965.1 elongation factor P [Myxococcota bacterium]
MYETSDIRKGLKITMDGYPWEVVDFQFVKPGKGTAFTRVRVKNLKTGQALDRTFKTGEKLEECDLEEHVGQYMYSDGENYFFMNQESYEQISIPASVLGDSALFLTENMECTILVFEGVPMNVALKTFLEAEIVYTEPGMKGDTATGGSKPAKISTGAEVQVPLFINQGDWIKVDTRDGSYVERVKK